ncbi:MAG: dTDP-4-dehydrorhamnose 3,5-epimerase [Omnitrophica WOR_2 bacterium RIFCSPHIGHO2_02_FULL_68_15]|nr:MAG: dTDP-4-dehydrorhamnose 3,5-epimerase [Omnitrophica WOR_2 bacterium RIFCSPHIGHO2_02_FULL_68_15]
MPLTCSPMAIPEVVLVTPQVFPDPRGTFYEGYRRDAFAAHGIHADFVQDNYNTSAKGVVRGLHYQIAPKAQAKLIRVLHGAIYDVAVDLRRGSMTFGRWVGMTLEPTAAKALYIPAGFAHGFCALEEGTTVMYKVTDFYSPAHERGIRWDDPALGIAWPTLGVPYQLSDRDRSYPLLKDAEPG